MELIDKKKFTKVALNKNFETFIMYVAALEASEMTIRLFWTAKVAFLQANKVFNKFFLEYLDYASVFLTNLAIKLLKHNNINDHAIKLVESKQRYYRLIYNLDLVKLETLKIYIKTHLKTGCI